MFALEYLSQCLKLSQKSCRSSCLESQIINIKLKKNQQKVLVLVNFLHIFFKQCQVYYRKISIIKHTFVGNLIVDHSDVVGASPVGAAPTTSSFST